MPPPPDSLSTLVDRFDFDVFDAPRGRARIRLEVPDSGAWDLEIRGERLRLRDAHDGDHPDALLSADERTWTRIGRALADGVNAHSSGRLRVRRDLHLGVGFLAATNASDEPDRLRFDMLDTALGKVSKLETGSGPPLVMLHGLGASKASFLPTVAALAKAGYRAIALDLPGFGDSDKPFPAAYDAHFFARWVAAALDALELDRVHLLGHSMGGRVALEMGLRHADRLESLTLLTPSLAWRGAKRWTPYLRMLRPELGILQPAPRGVVEGVVNRLLRDAGNEWIAAGVDEFLRSYLTPRGRVAFYAAARQIYLEDGDGDGGFWQRLEELTPRSMFVWGRRDQLVPIGFERHVRSVVPAARHIELDCGHVPQIESPRRVNGAIERFLRGEGRGQSAPGRAVAEREASSARVRAAR